MKQLVTGFYKSFGTVSTKNFKYFGIPTRSPGARFPAFIKNLNKFYELCGNNESEAARRIGVKPQHFNHWRSGAHLPSVATRKHIASVLKTDEHTLMHGEWTVNESPSVYAPKKKVDDETQEILEELLNSGDDAIIGHLKRQVLLLKDLLDYRRGKKSP